MVLANPPLAEPVTDPGGVINKPPFEMGVANFVNLELFGNYVRICLPMPIIIRIWRLGEIITLYLSLFMRI